MSDRYAPLQPLQPGFDTKSFAQPQQHSTVGTPPPFNNAQFQGAFPFQNTPGQAQAQFLTNPYFPMMHSPLPAQMQTHQTISGKYGFYSCIFFVAEAVLI